MPKFITEPQKIFNELDEVGLLLGLSRLPEERNPEYKQRLARVFAQRANSTYRGLINGISRGLGLDMFDAIRISPIEMGGSFLASNPAVVFNESKVYLYEDFKNDVLDKSIDRFDHDSPGFFLIDLVSEINASSFYSASIETDIDPYTRSMTILNQSSHEYIQGEEIPISTRFELENTNIVKGTIFFSDRTIFNKMVSSESEVNSPGDFWVNHKKGIVVVHNSPVPNTTVRYRYLKSPMICKASPVIIHNIQDDDFKIKLFEQVLSDQGVHVNGLPTNLGAYIINELLSVFPLHWGQ